MDARFNNFYGNGYSQYYNTMEYDSSLSGFQSCPVICLWLWSTLWSIYGYGYGYTVPYLSPSLTHIFFIFILLLFHHGSHLIQFFSFFILISFLIFLFSLFFHMYFVLFNTLPDWLLFRVT